MNRDYLDAAQEGKNQWWRYLIALLLILFFWLIFGNIPIAAAVAVVMADDDPTTDVGAFGLVGIDPLWNFTLLMFSFIAFLLGIVIAVRFIHQRPVRSLVTPAPRIDWGRIGQGFGVWAALAALIALIETLLFPARYQLTFNAVRFLPFVLFGILLIPLQTTAEELFFRGYVLQGFGQLTRNRLILVFLSGFLFMLPHLANPEVSAGPVLLALFYFSFGAFLALLTLKDNGLELALGAHAGNNLFTGILVNYEGSALPTPAIFTVSELDATFNLVASLVAMAVFYWLVFVVQRRK
ncbi:MAG TPA: type II CAAX endopeptidase family protein [Anaerolineae bacterium]